LAEFTRVAIGLVGEQPATGQIGVDGTADEVECNLGLGAEDDVIGNLGFVALLAIVRPALEGFNTVVLGGTVHG